MEQRLALDARDLARLRGSRAERLLGQGPSARDGLRKRRHHFRAVHFRRHQAGGLCLIPREHKLHAIGNFFKAVNGTNSQRQKRCDCRLARRSLGEGGAKPGHHKVHQPIRLTHLHVAPVHPRKFFRVEHSGAVTDTRHVKPARHLGRQHQLFAITWRPPEQREVIDERLGQIPARAELLHTRGAMPLRQRRMIGPQHQRQVCKGRRRQPERFVDQDLSRCVGNVILAANHMSHLHQRIVNDHGKVVGRPAIGSHDDRVTNHRGVEGHGAAHEIHKRDLTIGRHDKSNRRRFACGAPRLGLVTRQPAAAPGIFRRRAGSERRCAFLFELLRGAETPVGVPRVAQSGCVGRIQRQPLGLAIRGEGTTLVGTFIPIEAEPLQIRADAIFRGACGPFGVGVFDTQDERAALSAREQPVEQGRARIAHMQHARGTGRKTQTHRCHA